MSGCSPRKIASASSAASRSPRTRSISSSRNVAGSPVICERSPRRRRTYCAACALATCWDKAGLGLVNATSMAPAAAVTSSHDRYLAMSPPGTWRSSRASESASSCGAGVARRVSFRRRLKARVAGSSQPTRRRPSTNSALRSSPPWRMTSATRTRLESSDTSSGMSGSRLDGAVFDASGSTRRRAVAV